MSQFSLLPGLPGGFFGGCILPSAESSLQLSLVHCAQVVHIFMCSRRSSISLLTVVGSGLLTLMEVSSA